MTDMQTTVEPRFIKHGSPEHAVLLGLRKAREDDDIQLDGYALEDRTKWGPTASEGFLKETLRGKVNELQSPVPKPQSDEPFKANYAPKLWRP